MFTSTWRALSGQVAHFYHLSIMQPIVSISIGCRSRMPEMDGLEAARRIREQDKDVKIFIMSMYGECEQQVLAAGANGLFSKADSLEKLLAAIEAIARGITGTEYVLPIRPKDNDTTHAPVIKISQEKDRRKR